jgi:3-phosphoshikimate 1-carboxyvinyltransferase
MMPLLSALENLGATIFESSSGKCPFIIKGPLKVGRTTVSGISSQFLTSLLIACPLAENDSEITVEKLNEKPYVEMTLGWLEKFDVKLERDGLERFLIRGGQKYKSFERVLPGDFSSASFPLCGAAITGSAITIKGLDFTDHQGDKEVFNFLCEMGLKLTYTDNGVLVEGGNMKGIDIDMNNTPDALPAMAVAACFAEGTTRLLNVPQARLKECDRIAATAKELGKMGADITELADGLVIRKSRLKGAKLHGYNDHRMVMALAVAGLAADGETTVDTAEAVGVTYPGFVNDMKIMGAKVDLFDDLVIG